MDGRPPPRLLEFCPEGQVVIGVDLGRTKMFGAIADLAGNVLGEADMNRHRTSGEKNFQRLTDLIDTLLASPKIQGRRIRGLVSARRASRGTEKASSPGLIRSSGTIIRSRPNWLSATTCPSPWTTT
jgi:predicted NBD/HSP70 family sugar kinase